VKRAASSMNTLAPVVTRDISPLHRRRRHRRCAQNVSVVILSRGGRIGNAMEGECRRRAGKMIESSETLEG
jgi:hypothetical protein